MHLAYVWVYVGVVCIMTSNVPRASKCFFLPWSYEFVFVVNRFAPPPVSVHGFSHVKVNTPAID